MKPLLLLALWVLFSVARAAVIEAPQEIRDGIVHQALYALAFDGERGVAVGRAGQILESSDGGKTWNEVPSPGHLGLMGVTLAGERGIAVGQMGRVLLREDGAWKPADSGTTERLLNVAMNASGLAAAVGAFGTVRVSEDAGKTWREALPEWGRIFAAHAESLGESFSPHLYTVRVTPEGEIMIAGEMGVILRSRNAGADWSLAYLGLQPDGSGKASIFGLDIGSDGRGLAVGQEALALRTTDGGETWAPIELPTKANLLAVSLAPDGAAVVLAFRDMLVSPDFGENWTRVPGADAAIGWYSDADPAPVGGGIIAVGHSGRIIRIRPG